MVDSFSEVIDIVLYRHNYIDNQLWHIFSSDENVQLLDNDAVLAPVFILQDLVNANFSNEIRSSLSINSNLAYAHVNSVSFLLSIIQSSPSIRWIRFSISNDMKYTRTAQTSTGMAVIKFSMKTISGTIRLHDFFNLEDLPIINEFLFMNSILKPGDNFAYVDLSSLLDVLEVMIESVTEDLQPAVEEILNLLGKHEGDAPEVLLVTDI